jgi:nicotinamidase/pyrazinamidase
MATGDALVIVDVQNDFVPGGRLAVPHGDEVIEPLNQAISSFVNKGLPVVATRDWHPPNHCSFDDQGGPWPPHCIAGSPGAEFHPDLRLPADVKLVSKATHPDADAYSGFDGTQLANWLRERGVTRIIVGGLATDYCVKETVKDALKGGFEVIVLDDAVRAVDLQPGDGARALEAIERRGARRMRSADLDDI